ncbi:hybrid sensor histidine kinase/response regulator [Pseudomonas sp. LRF_L74]|uniref:hybrid sensor histidine kinase/response regulator n=1 Tax=Pseudomonas sp. LRF_L74 TaxID=3369422 RepID=UPI003F619143
MSHPPVPPQCRILLCLAKAERRPEPGLWRDRESTSLIQIDSPEQLPPPDHTLDVLLTSLSWAKALSPAQCEQLAAHGRAVGAWKMLADTAPNITEHLHWHGLGVDRFLPMPGLAPEWSMLLDWLCSRLRAPSRERQGEEEARFRFFLDNVEEGVVVCDKGIIVDVSDRWLELFRCSRDEAIGQPVLDYTGPRAVPMAQQLIEERWAEAYESEMLRKDGTTFPAIVRGRDQIFNGRELRLTTILDITRQKEAERALKLAKSEAERANHAKSEFLSSMSHELRTPLNAVLGFAQVLEMDDRLSADQLDSIGEILKAGSHLLGLINEVLDLASIESGRMSLSLETVDAAALAYSCTQLVQPLATSRQVTLHLDIAEGTVVHADHQRLKQVLLNLLSNAIKYNHPGGEVRLSAECGDRRVRIVIADTGAGIAPERLGELFQPFSRLGAERAAVEGTGIGLVITRKLAEAMSGQVGVDSELGEGSRFWIELPVAQSVPQQASRMIGDASFALLTAKQEQRYILYIDDNPVNLKLVSQILDRLRHIHLVTMHAPDIGIEFALAHQPDLIMLDINLPGMDGYQVLRVLQSHLQLRHVPVIAVSANAMPRDIERGIAAGFADYLTKPLDIGRFLSCIDTQMAGPTSNA